MKRIVIFIIACIVFVLLGVNSTGDIAFLAFSTWPFRAIAAGLRDLSLKGPFSNVLSLILYSFVILLPLFYLAIEKYRNQASFLDYIFLPVLTLALSLGLYFYINPHLVILSLNTDVQSMLSDLNSSDFVTIVMSGIAYIFYSLFAIYIIIKIYKNKQLGNPKIIQAVIDIIILIAAFSLLTLSLSNMIGAVKSTIVVEEKILERLLFVMQAFSTLLLIYLLNQFRSFILELDKNGFDESILTLVQKVSRLSFVLLIMLFASQIIKNIYQYIVLSSLYNVNFIFELPIATILLTSFIYLLSKYIFRVIELRKENDMII